MTDYKNAMFYAHDLRATIKRSPFTQEQVAEAAEIPRGSLSGLLRKEMLKGSVIKQVLQAIDELHAANENLLELNANGICMRKARDKAHMEQEKAAELLGISSSTIIGMERGRYKSIKKSILRSMAQLYRVDYQELLNPNVIPVKAQAVKVAQPDNQPAPVRQADQIPQRIIIKKSILTRICDKARTAQHMPQHYLSYIAIGTSVANVTLTLLVLARIVAK